MCRRVLPEEERSCCRTWPTSSGMRRCRVRTSSGVTRSGPDPRPQPISGPVRKRVPTRRRALSSCAPVIPSSPAGSTACTGRPDHRRLPGSHHVGRRPLRHGPGRGRSAHPTRRPCVWLEQTEPPEAQPAAHLQERMPCASQVLLRPRPEGRRRVTRTWRSRTPLVWVEIVISTPPSCRCQPLRTRRTPLPITDSPATLLSLTQPPLSCRLSAVLATGLVGRI